MCTESSNHFSFVCVGHIDLQSVNSKYFQTLFAQRSARLEYGHRIHSSTVSNDKSMARTRGAQNDNAKHIL